jgi:hypothetical protein
MTTSILGSDIDGPPPAMRLRVDPEFRLERRQDHVRGRSALRSRSTRNISLAVACLFALMGVAAASFTLSKHNMPSESVSLMLPSAPSVSRDRQELPTESNGAQPTLADKMPVPGAVRPSDTTPRTIATDANIAANSRPLLKTAAIPLRRQQPRRPTPTVHKRDCSDCPPIDAADLPPLGPTAGRN